MKTQLTQHYQSVTTLVSKPVTLMGVSLNDLHRASKISHYAKAAIYNRTNELQKKFHTNFKIVTLMSAPRNTLRKIGLKCHKKSVTLMGLIYIYLYKIYIIYIGYKGVPPDYVCIAQGGEAFCAKWPAFMGRGTPPQKPPNSVTHRSKVFLCKEKSVTHKM